MEALSIKEIVKACSGKCLYNNEDLLISNICTDSRKVTTGDLYIPLIGENFDGHDFIESAVSNGASLVLTEIEINNLNIPYILVDDTLKALQAIAKYYRHKFNIPFIAVTGSSGKTTTKDMIAAILEKKFKVLKTEGNFNNGIGLPLTLFRLEKAHEVCVIEMGMSGLGEIQLLADIVQPDIAVITNVGTAHIEKLGSRENILKAKMEITAYFNRENVLVINGEDEMLRNYENTQFNVIKYGVEDNDDIKAFNIEEKGEAGIGFEVMVDGRAAYFFVSLPGIHNVYNALSGIYVSLKLGLDIDAIRSGLLDFKPSKMRMEIFSTSKGVRVINDVYNANPESMAAAIRVLKGYKPEHRTVGILGEMLELGDHAEQAHYTLGSLAYDEGVDILLAVGNYAEAVISGAIDRGADRRNTYFFSNNNEAIALLQRILLTEDAVLVKGSRGIKMEQIVDFLRERG